MLPFQFHVDTATSFKKKENQIHYLEFYLHFFWKRLSHSNEVC